MDSNEKTTQTIEANLGLWDAVSIVVGIIIGVGIFVTPATIFSQAPHPSIAIALWVLGGVLALIGAFCFAELASTYPHSGGEYVYLTRAFGPLTGFLFAWAQLAVIRSGSIAGLAYIFGQSAAPLVSDDVNMVFVLAGMSVAILTLINFVGVRMGTGTQNILTVGKVLGLAALIVVGFTWGKPERAVSYAPAVADDAWFVPAMIFVLWSYSGWHEAAYIVAEAKNRTRNIPLALILGTSIVTIIYVLINLAYLFGLGFEGAKQQGVAENLLKLAWPSYGARAMSILIMVSSLGAINGMIFTTARMYSAFGRDHWIFKLLDHWSERWKTPDRALLVQGVICLTMIVGVWYAGGGVNSFNALVEFTAAAFWTFFCLTGVAVLVLRAKDPNAPRPFRVPGYPAVPLLFCAWCAYMVFGAIQYDLEKQTFNSLIGLGILVVGLPFYYLPKLWKERQPAEELQPISK